MLFLCQLDVKYKLLTKYIVMKKIGFIILFTVFMSNITFAQKQPKMVFEKTEHNFGTIKEEIGAVTTRFEFKNTGDTPLVIQRVSASCGCTTPSYTREPILPGKTGTVSAQYSTVRRPGSFNKTIRVYTNVPDTVYTLTIKGNVTPKQ